LNFGAHTWANNILHFVHGLLRGSVVAIISTLGTAALISNSGPHTWENNFLHFCARLVAWRQILICISA